MKLSSNNSSNLSRTALENALMRALQFLRAAGSDANIMDLLKQTGFGEAAMKQGWSLVLTAYAASGPAAASIIDTPLNDAVTKVDAWQSSMFVRTHAVLRRFHPEQDTFVFDNLEPGDGIAAVAAVSTFLDRLDALESSPERKSSRKADHAALELLEQRGVTKEQRKEMRSLVKWVESTPAQQSGAPAKSPRENALGAVYDSIQDWADCARTVVTRRDQLIRLGIAKRRPRKSDAQPAPTPAPAPIVPPIVATPVAPATDSASTNPALVAAAQMLALPPKSTNGATPGAAGSIVGGASHA